MKILKGKLSNYVIKDAFEAEGEEEEYSFGTADTLIRWGDDAKLLYGVEPEFKNFVEQELYGKLVNGEFGEIPAEYAAKQNEAFENGDNTFRYLGVYKIPEKFKKVIEMFELTEDDPEIVLYHYYDKSMNDGTLWIMTPVEFGSVLPKYWGLNEKQTEEAKKANKGSNKTEYDFYKEAQKYFFEKIDFKEAMASEEADKIYEKISKEALDPINKKLKELSDKLYSKEISKEEKEEIGEEIRKLNIEKESIEKSLREKWIEEIKKMPKRQYNREYSRPTAYWNPEETWNKLSEEQKARVQKIEELYGRKRRLILEELERGKIQQGRNYDVELDMIEKTLEKNPDTTEFLVDSKVKDSLKIISGMEDYEPWSGAVETYEKIEEANKLDDLEDLLEECYPDGLSMTQLNDILWFDDEWVLEQLGMLEDESADAGDVEEDDEIKDEKKPEEMRTEKVGNATLHYGSLEEISKKTGVSVEELEKYVDQPMSAIKSDGNGGYYLIDIDVDDISLDDAKCADEKKPTWLDDDLIEEIIFELYPVSIEEIVDVICKNGFDSKEDATRYVKLYLKKNPEEWEKII